jgi:hypothetical protein
MRRPALTKLNSRRPLAPPAATLSEEASGLLRSNETPSVDAQMAVGNVVQKMEVAATSPLVESETSTTGTILAGKEMNTLPIMQRYTWMTMYLMPDVTSMNGFHIDGQRDRGLGYSLDGIAGTQPIVGGLPPTGSYPPPNAIEGETASTVLPAEFDILPAACSAQPISRAEPVSLRGRDRYVNNDMLHRAYFLSAMRPQLSRLSSLVSGPSTCRRFTRNQQDLLPVQLVHASGEI